MIKPLHLKNGRKIGPGYPAYIIAEIGSNHDGSLERAKNLVSLAKKAKADAVKFQSFQAHLLTNRFTKEGNDWIKESSYEILEQLTVPVDWHIELAKHCKEEEIDFFSTPFDLERLKLLDELDVPLIKIASGDLTNNLLLEKAAKLHRPIIISTGAAYLREIEIALKILKENHAKDIAILQCVSSYPAEFKDANLLSMKTIQDTFQVPVGYSDHTPGIVVPIATIALGGSIIEKHFTDDKNRIGPDHPHSLDTKEFSLMVRSIRELEEAFGSEIKKPSTSEIHERVMARRAIYATQNIPAGTIIKENMIKIVRHAFPEGILAAEHPLVIGRKTIIDIQEHEILTWEKISQ